MKVLPTDLGNYMDKVKGFQPLGNPPLSIHVISTDILELTMEPEDPYVNVDFEPPTYDIGMLLVVELEPSPNMNGGSMIDDVEVPIVDVLNGGKIIPKYSIIMRRGSPWT